MSSIFPKKNKVFKEIFSARIAVLKIVGNECVSLFRLYAAHYAADNLLWLKSGINPDFPTYISDIYIIWRYDKQKSFKRNR